MQRLAILILLLIPGVSLGSTDFSVCQEHYEKRAQISEILAAHDCFWAKAEEAKASGELTARREALEKTLLSAVWIVAKNRPEEGAPNTQETRDFRLSWIEKARAVSESLVQEFPEIGSGYYWRATFITFKCREDGETSRGIRCIFGALSEIESDFNQALKIDPDYHGAGTERALAYKARAEYQFGKPGANLSGAAKWAAKAVKRAPLCTLNAMIHAEALIHWKKPELARPILEKLISLDPHNPEQVDPAFIQEAIDDQLKAKKILENL